MQSFVYDKEKLTRGSHESIFTGFAERQEYVKNKSLDTRLRKPVNMRVMEFTAIFCIAYAKNCRGKKMH